MSKRRKSNKTPQILSVAREQERAARVQHLADSGGRSAFRSVTFPNRKREANRKACRGRQW